MRLRVTTLLLFCSFIVFAQEQTKEKTFIKNDVRTWKLSNMFTYADTIPVDTATNLHQINNPLFQQSVGWVTTGNIGAPAQALFFPDVKRHDGNIFLTPLLPYLEQPEDYVFYNTKTPYANFTYQNGYPKRRSEEYVHILFTQNVNRRINIGAKLAVRSSIGRYESQRTDHSDFRLHGSYNGDYYSGHGSISYHKAKIEENGGVLKDEYVYDPQDDKYKNPEDVPVKTMNSLNRTSLYRFFYTHSFDLAHVDRVDEDSSIFEVPVMTAYHTFDLETTHRWFKMGDLKTDKNSLPMIFPNNLEAGKNFKLYDDQRVADTTRYVKMHNTFQLKMTEEYNSLLRFGLRVFVEHELHRYVYPDTAVVTEKETAYGDVIKTLHYRQSSPEVQNNIILGGEIFKHRGDNLSFDAMAKIYVLGKRDGDFEIDGHVKTTFPFLCDTTISVWGKANFQLRSPSFWENKYVSNIYRWNNKLSKEENLTIKGGIRFNGWNTEIMVYYSLLNDRIYYAFDGMPATSPHEVNVLGAQLKTHLHIWGFNTINTLALQESSDADVVSLPRFIAYSSNFFEHRFFDVLTFQLGADLQYNTAFFAPQYNPATMQFCSQVKETRYDEKGNIILERRDVGDYLYFDPFINIQIKRVRAYFKYSHLNSIWGSGDHFMTVGYPANPKSMKFGISWNFYD